eukprot:CAMPEP_0176354164 /NCGR_PEP_ID=MMETSP0126-20121128/12348_1 /TAXON_ID=141414 ORGANISM="Strombidinopsis acuminatum, Strain SPMC142" /NCGR_SAMPLE_ID=MMETSP0126 /ASSEMBLY_ACC=CAM_ASM_000229 /LENGTH=70 /DNA_ID=CAMNT_0017706195 /DNA_START=1156 /DNA_END=1368 /DNA_ORIENTATION=+
MKLGQNVHSSGYMMVMEVMPVLSTYVIIYIILLLKKTAFLGNLRWLSEQDLQRLKRNSLICANKKMRMET